MMKLKSFMKLSTLNYWSHWGWSLFRGLLIIGICFIILYPIVQKISVAFKHKDDLYNRMVIWIPQQFTLDNFKVVWAGMDYSSTVVNTLILCALVTVIQTAICALAGYGFARLKFRGSGLLFSFVIFTILVPPQTVMLPNYLNFQSFNPFGVFHLIGKPNGFNLLGTYWPFVISAMTGMGIKSGLFIYIFRQVFRSLPKEIEESSLVEGASVFGSFSRIMLPNAIPGLVTVMLFTFVWQWNDVFYTFMYVGQNDIMSIKLSTLTTSMASSMTTGINQAQLDPFYLSMLLDTGILLAIVPLIVMYLFAQRYFVESVERTGIVG